MRVFTRLEHSSARVLPRAAPGLGERRPGPAPMVVNGALVQQPAPGRYDRGAAWRPGGVRVACRNTGIGRRGQVGMAILTRDEIIHRVRAGEIGIDPFDEQFVGPASVDLHLASQFRVFKRVRDIFHVTEEAAYEDVSEIVEVADGDYFVLMPGETCHGLTRERIRSAGRSVRLAPGQEPVRAPRADGPHYGGVHSAGHRQPSGAGDQQRGTDAAGTPAWHQAVPVHVRDVRRERALRGPVPGAGRALS